jgi:hypothetical protein
MARDLDNELDLALVGDFERLRAGSADARFFAEAFGPDVGRTARNLDDLKTVVGLGAFCVSCERQDNIERAREGYAELDKTSGWSRLFGLLLRSWSPALGTSETLRDAREALAHLRPGARRARLSAKLSLIAADKGDLELARDLWQAAVNTAPRLSRLRRVLATEAMNLGVSGIDREDVFTEPEGPDDPLLFPQSLTELRLRSLSSALIQATEDGFGGTWSYTMRMGLTPLDEIYAADLEATWRGLAWLRRSIRKQIGAQLLAGSAVDPGQWAYGVLMWILGGANAKPNQALRYAEPHLDPEGANFIVASVRDCDFSGNRHLHLASLGAEAWDLLSEDLLEWLAREVPLEAGLGFPAEEGRLIWAGFALRATKVWFAEYQQLSTGDQASLLQHLTPHSLRHFDSEMRETMYSAISGDEALFSDQGAILPMAVALAPTAEHDRLRRLLDEAEVQSRVISQLLDEFPDIVSAKRQESALAMLKNQVDGQLKEAREGTIYGGTSPALDLGRFLSVAQVSDHDAIELLIQAASDPGLPIRYVLDARQGLILLRRANELSDGQLKRLAEAPDPGHHIPQFEGISPQVVRMFLLRLLVDRLTKAQEAELEAAVRDPDDKVRSVAVNACAEALRYTGEEGLAWAVVSGLFDPSHSVAESALAGLPSLTERLQAPADVAWRRLPALLDVGSRDVRRAVVEAVGRSKPSTELQEQRSSGLMSRARQDRSWRVREVAKQLESD